MRKVYLGHLVFAVLAQSLLCAQTHVNVTTWHNDNLRSGQNTSETTLVPGTGSVDQATFGTIRGQEAVKKLSPEPTMPLRS